MRRQLGAPGDFAWAYVIAHEIGHHVQNLLGTNDEVDRLSATNPDKANELSVRTELQADCYRASGRRPCSSEGDLEQGDIDEAFTATEAVGDDRSPRRPGGASTPTASPTAAPSSAGTGSTPAIESGRPGGAATRSRSTRSRLWGPVRR